MEAIISCQTERLPTSHVEADVQLLSRPLRWLAAAISAGSIVIEVTGSNPIGEVWECLLPALEDAF